MEDFPVLCVVFVSHLIPSLSKNVLSLFLYKCQNLLWYVLCLRICFDSYCSVFHISLRSMSFVAVGCRLNFFYWIILDLQYFISFGGTVSFFFFIDYTPLKLITVKFLGGPVARIPCSQCRALGSIPGQGSRSHMLQL